MRNFFSVIIIFGILLVMGGYVYVQKQDVAQREEISKNLSSVRRNFASRARDAINQGDGEAYLRNIKAAIKSYEEELERTVYKTAPEARDVDGYVKKVEEEFENCLVTLQPCGWRRIQSRSVQSAGPFWKANGQGSKVKGHES